MAVTFSDLVGMVRVLSFDRVQVPVLYLKKQPDPNWLFMLSGGNAVITKNSDSSIIDSTTTTTTLMDYFNAISINPNVISVAMSFGAKDEDLLSDILPTAKNFAGTISLFKKYYSTPTQILNLFKLYIIKHSHYLVDCVTQAQMDCAMNMFCRSERHLALWIAYFVVEDRRVAEAASNMMEIRFTNAPDDFCEGFTSFSSTTPNVDVAMAISDVFHLSDNEQKISMSKDVSKLGVENMFGDNGFWWRYQNYLRLMLEREFGDYSLRTPNMYQSQITLSGETKIYEWYQAHPYQIYQFPDSLLGGTQGDLISGGSGLNY